MKGKFCILLYLILMQNVLHAQVNPLTTSKKAEELYREAKKNCNNQQFAQALQKLTRALYADPGFTDAWILRGDVYAALIPRTGSDSLTKLALADYYKAVSLDSLYYPPVYYTMATMEKQAGDYSRALQHFRIYLQHSRVKDLNEVEKEVRNCIFALNALSHPVEFNPEPLGNNVNTADNEYVNAITADGHQLLLTRARYFWETPRGSDDAEKLMLAEANGSDWLRAKEIIIPGTEDASKGAACISADGRLLFFSMIFDNYSYGTSRSYDIYCSEKRAEGWSLSQNLGDKCNSVAWDTQPSISTDGKTLYFVSNRQGGKGGSDIWISNRMPDGSWGNAINLGDSVNTGGNEMAPFIHPDNQTLYFSSDGHPGMGGMDIFMVKKNGKGGWHQPVNIGYPINTYRNELNMVVDAAGEYAYISSDKEGEKTKNDIYRFRLPGIAHPLSVGYCKGKVFDSKTHKPLQADFQLLDIQTGMEIFNAFSDSLTGSFFICLPSGKNYALNVSKTGYLFYSDSFWLHDSANVVHPVQKNVALQKIEIGSNTILYNIFFATDSFALQSGSETELNKLVTFLALNPQLHVEIGGHTDNAGEETYNLQLSQQRAQSVIRYLLQKGIAAQRLRATGYGESRPIADNSMEAGRARNRRTEITITGIK
ncbi:MAG: OmpA family protein [Lentimicrobiaceae bacterium]|nr:OmpA family protein [Lentimicrobiaceae bacterium]